MKKTKEDGSAILGYSALKIRFHKKNAYLIYMEPHIYALKAGGPLHKKSYPTPPRSKDVAIFSAGKGATFTTIKMVGLGPFVKEGDRVQGIGILGMRALNMKLVQQYDGPRRVNRPQGKHFARHADGVPCVILQ